MFEKIKDQIDVFEEKVSDFLDDHPTSVLVASVAAYVVMMGGVGVYYIRKAKTDRLMVKEIGRLTTLLDTISKMD